MRAARIGLKGLNIGLIGMCLTNGISAQPPEVPPKGKPPADSIEDELPAEPRTKSKERKDKSTAEKPVSIPPPPGTMLRPDELPIDLGSALRLAGVENPDILFARERVTEAVAIRQLAAAQILPNINVGLNYDLHRGPLQQSNGNILNVNRDAMYIGLGANAIAAGSVNIPGINYNLNVGNAWFGALQARQLVAGRRAAARAAENDTFLRVCLAYMDLLRADGRRAIAAENRSEAAEVVRITAAYAEAGQGRRADADRATVELNRRDVELVQAEADTLIATARLARLLNMDPSTRLKPVDGWVVPAEIVPDAVPMPDLIATAVMQRPELAERRAEIQATIYALSAAKFLPFSPNVIMGFSGGGFGGGSNLISSPDGFVAGDGQRIVAPRFGDLQSRADLDVVAYWTLQNLGVGNVALVRQAASVNRQAMLRELETLNRVRAEVAEVYADTHARFLQIDSTERAVRSGRKGYEEDLARIKGQQGLPIELLDSLRLLNRGRYEYLDAIIGYNRAQFRLYVVLGQPPASVLARSIPADLVPAPVVVPMPGQLLPPGMAPAGPRVIAMPRLPQPRPVEDAPKTEATK